MLFLQFTRKIDSEFRHDRQCKKNMSHVYVVIENGELYPVLYSNYASARKAVTTKYAVELRNEWDEAQELNDPDYQIVSQIVDENEKGATALYIRNGKNIIIQRYDLSAAKH